MLIFCLILAVLCGWLRGGTLGNIGTMRLKNSVFILLGLGLNIGITFIGATGNDLVLQYINELYILSYVFLLIGIAFNVKYRAMIVIGLGTLANAVVFLVNRGVPISIEGLRMSGQGVLADLVSSGEKLLYVPLSEATKIPIFSKMITVQIEIPFENIYSFGDIAIMVGLFALVQFIMLNDQMERFVRLR
ncbi:MAG: DUF5317 domain-containing protein [Tissierellales bacterium]|jgi:hypothetical protein|nr:DUF5317 domain-containing protein [Tissierellales bacterium]